MIINKEVDQDGEALMQVHNQMVSQTHAEEFPELELMFHMPKVDKDTAANAANW